MRGWRAAPLWVLPLLMLVYGWLVTLESSPFYNYFLNHPALRDLWVNLNTPAFILEVALSVGPNAGNPIMGTLCIAIQWFLVGLLIWRLLTWVAPARSQSSSE
jgi:hypothetical protein